MAANPKKQLALDTNVLLELADSGEVATDFRETFQAKGYTLLIPSRVVTELHLIEADAEREDARFATITLEKLRAWEIKALDLPEVSQAIARRFAEALIRKRLLPPEEISDGRILGETAVAGIPGLVTFDKHLLDIDEDQLRLALDEADLPSAAIVHPRRLLRALR